ncbi:MAG: nucleotidyltransferase domain-containing protein [Candidatus Omnitrophica bacterium]|nr:nucleotidyltransferase domain-containing protein [Candidatus Omnitrophota bacterium]
MKVKFKQIKIYAEKIKEKFSPKKIILFGSYASGKITKDSDVDLLIIIDTKIRSINQAVLIRKEIPSPFPLDLIVKTPDEVKERIKKGDFFMKTIVKKGKHL